MMISTAARLIPVLAAAATVLGCASNTPYLDSKFGYAVNNAKALQTRDLNASKNPDPVAGMDGVSAKEGIERYQNSFKEPPPTFEVFLGTATSAR